MTLFQDDNTVSNNELIFPVSNDTKRIIHKFFQLMKYSPILYNYHYIIYM